MRPLIALFLIVLLAACGGGAGSSGGGSNPPPPSSVMLQQGQWEFAVTGQNIYLEADLTGSGNDVSADYLHTDLINTSVPSSAPPGSFYSCGGGVETGGTVSGNSLTGTVSGAPVGSTFSGGEIVSFAGTLSSNGQSISGTVDFLATAEQDCLWGPSGSFSFAGYSVAPLNGTFSGQITSPSGPLQLTLQLSQDSTLNVTGSGTASGQGISENFVVISSISGSSNDGSNVRGARLRAACQMTPHSSTYVLCTMSGHFEPGATQIPIVISIGDTSYPDNGYNETGILTKQ